MDHDYAEPNQPMYLAIPYASQYDVHKQKLDGTEEESTGKKVTKSRRLICCVPACHTTGYGDIQGHGKPSYHSFPPVGDPLRAVWLNKIKRNEDLNFKVQSHTVVCSLHFEANSTEVSGFAKRRYLKPGAVPTLFECWKNKPHLYKAPRNRAENALQKKRDTICSEKDENVHNYDIPSVSDSETNDELPLNSNSSFSQTDEVEAQNHFLVEQIKLLEKQKARLQEENNKLKVNYVRLQKENDMNTFSVENLKPSEFSFYTGFPSKAVFDAVLQLVDPGERGENVILVPQKDENNLIDVQKVRKPRKLSPANQFFLFMCRVRVGMFETDLARRFNISIGTVSTIIISWANFLFLRLGMMNIWPSRQVVNDTMPSTFKEKYPSTRVIIDATEIKVEMASSLLLKSQTYSSYKSSNTLKGLIGIAPQGSITFVSQLFHGNISDREITVRSGFLNLPFENGDSIMCDKGFDIQDLLDSKGVHLNLPPFLSQYGQMTNDQVRHTQSIAAERIHVERAINKIKNFHIFDQVIPVSLFGSVNQIWTVCALLTLFQDPIISCPGS